MGGVEELDAGVVVSYQKILPILVVLGVVGSAGSIVVLSQPSIRNSVGNKYFLALSWCDLLLSLSYIIVAVTASGCLLQSYASAWFFAHFGWTITCTFHALGTYIIIFMSLDRFIGVWFPVWFKPLTQSPFGFNNRLVFAAALCFGLHIVFMIDAEVQCVEARSSIDNCTVDLKPLNNCTDGDYISNDGFQKSFDKLWHVVYRYIYNTMVRWLPCALLIILNLSLVLAVATGRVKLPRSQDKATQSEAVKKRSKNKKETVLVATAIAMTASYVLLTMPITVYLTVFVESSECRCEESSPEETLRHVGNIFQILEHVMHVMYLLFINPSFRKELFRLLKCQKSSKDGSETDELSPPNSGRPLSYISRSLSKVSSTSMRPAPRSKSSCGMTVVTETLDESNLLSCQTEETSVKSNSLCSDSARQSLEETKSLCSDTARQSLEETKSLCSDSARQSLEETKSLCSDSARQSLEETKSLCSDSARQSLEETKSLCSDTARQSLEETKSLCSDSARQSLEETKSLCSDSARQSLEETKSLCSDSARQSLEETKSLCSDSARQSLEETKSLCSDTARQSLEETKSLCSDAARQSLEETKSLCSDAAGQSLEETKFLCSDIREETTEE